MRDGLRSWFDGLRSRFIGLAHGEFSCDEGS